ncbi:uncharacterized, partial [Tachysurus ichikawai]
MGHMETSVQSTAITDVLTVLSSFFVLFEWTGHQQRITWISGPETEKVSNTYVSDREECFVEKQNHPKKEEKHSEARQSHPYFCGVKKNTSINTRLRKTPPSATRLFISFIMLSSNCCSIPTLLSRVTVLTRLQR